MATESSEIPYDEDESPEFNPAGDHHAETAEEFDPGTEDHNVQPEGDQHERADEQTGGGSIVGESPKRSYKKRRDSSQLRKAPQAPKRFKSSYICFFMAKQPDIKGELGAKATVTEISKRSAEMWRNLPADKRAHWDDVAAKDKERYLHEKASYKGPWQVPWKRAKKDPSAPKRPMSAFLYFSQGRRKKIKDQNPDMKNTEVSRMLGEKWRNSSEEERRPYVEKEKKEREKYKVAIATWRKEFEAKKEEQRKAEEQAQAQQSMGWAAPGQYAPDVSTPMDPSAPQMQYAQHPTYMPPPGYAPYPAAPYGYPAPYPPQPMYQYPTNGKQPVILGPNGMPHNHPHYQPGPPAPHAQPPPQPQYASPAPLPPQPQQAPAPPPLQTYDENQAHQADVPNYDFGPGQIQEPLVKAD